MNLTAVSLILFFFVVLDLYVYFFYRIMSYDHAI